MKTAKLQCKCPANSPFHWQGTPCEIDWGSSQRSADTSASTSRFVNNQRAKGIEPSQHNPGRVPLLDPKKFHVYSKAGGK